MSSFECRSADRSRGPLADELTSLCLSVRGDINRRDCYGDVRFVDPFQRRSEPVFESGIEGPDGLAAETERVRRLSLRQALDVQRVVDPSQILGQRPDVPVDDRQGLKIREVIGRLIRRRPRAKITGDWSDVDADLSLLSAQMIDDDVARNLSQVGPVFAHAVEPAPRPRLERTREHVLDQIEQLGGAGPPAGCAPVVIATQGIRHGVRHGPNIGSVDSFEGGPVAVAEPFEQASPAAQEERHGRFPTRPGPEQLLTDAGASRFEAIIAGVADSVTYRPLAADCSSTIRRNIEMIEAATREDFLQALATLFMTPPPRCRF